jgi:hypothetical protein
MGNPVRLRSRGLSVLSKFVGDRGCTRASQWSSECSNGISEVERAKDVGNNRDVRCSPMYYERDIYGYDVGTHCLALSLIPLLQQSSPNTRCSHMHGASMYI